MTTRDDALVAGNGKESAARLDKTRPQSASQNSADGQDSLLIIIVILIPICAINRLKLGL
jgi:hypothetical protein